MNTDVENLFKDKVLGHPAGLFVLFFTEMWERFSFYGMRVLLINFLTMAAISYNPGWEWSAENAGALFGTYAMLLYITPILGGMIADKYTGYRWAVVIGSLIMTLGHAAMAFETEASLYIGLALLVIGTGFFKPNITSIISEMYKNESSKKDGAYTIFYMGVNAGAFFGMMLCGYIAERVGWSYGFGLAGIFMLLGTIQFHLAKPLFGSVGGTPEEIKAYKDSQAVEKAATDLEETEKLNPFTMVDKVLIAISAVLGLGYAINDPMSKIGGFDLFSWLKMGDMEGQYVAVLIALGLFLFLVVSRLARYTPIVRDRMIAFIIFAFFTVFFWMSFEQGATSLILFARDSVDRVLSGGAATAFQIVNALLTVIPLVIITYVLVLLYKKTKDRIMASNITLFICFGIMWGLAVWMLNRDFQTVAYDVSYSAVESVSTDGEGKTTTTYSPVTEMMNPAAGSKIVERTVRIAEPIDFKIGEEVLMIHKDNEKSSFAYLNPERAELVRSTGSSIGKDNGIVKATIKEVKNSEVEITVSWFSILNSFFIIAFASMFSKWWESKYNPSASMKYGLGLIIMAIGFGLLAWGSYGIQEGVKVSMIWLILAYLFHTLGELCLSPVGLSYVSKLVPGRMIAFMFGVWYLAIAIGNKLAAILGGQIENITEQYDLSTFFLIFTVVPIVAGLLVIAMNPLLKKLMHGVK